MSEEKVDKVDYYESFEIYKDATNRIIKKVRANRSFSFDDTPVDPRKLVAGHNIKDLKADGYTPKVKRLSFGVEQRKVKTKEEKRYERFLAWQEDWSQKIDKHLESFDESGGSRDLYAWIMKSKGMRSSLSVEAVSADYGQYEEKISLVVPLFKKEQEANTLLEQRREEEERAFDKFIDDFIPQFHDYAMRYYYHFFSLLGGDKIVYVPELSGLGIFDHELSPFEQKYITKTRRILNIPLVKIMETLEIPKVGNIHKTIKKRKKNNKFNHLAEEICESLFSDIKDWIKQSQRDSSVETFFYFLSKRYDPKMFLNGIDDLRTILKEMKDHGATKEEQEGRNQSEEKSS